jgi:hypothetical protein
MPELLVKGTEMGQDPPPVHTGQKAPAPVVGTGVIGQIFRAIYEIGWNQQEWYVERSCGALSECEAGSGTTTTAFGASAGFREMDR